MHVRDVTCQPNLVLNVTEGQRFYHATAHAHLDLPDVSDNLKPFLDDMSILIGQSINQIVERFCARHG